MLSCVIPSTVVLCRTPSRGGHHLCHQGPVGCRRLRGGDRPGSQALALLPLRAGARCHPLGRDHLGHLLLLRHRLVQQALGGHPGQARSRRVGAFRAAGGRRLHLCHPSGGADLAGQTLVSTRAVRWRFAAGGPFACARIPPGFDRMGVSGDIWRGAGCDRPGALPSNV